MRPQHVNDLDAFVFVLEERDLAGPALIEKGATKTVSFLTSSPLTTDGGERGRESAPPGRQDQV